MILSENGDSQCQIFDPFSRPNSTYKRTFAIVTCRLNNTWCFLNLWPPNDTHHFENDGHPPFLKCGLATAHRGTKRETDRDRQRDRKRETESRRKVKSRKPRQTKADKNENREIPKEGAGCI